MTYIEPLKLGSVALARSQVMDAFAILERAVQSALKSSSCLDLPEGAALGQKLEKLANIAPSSLMSKAACSRISAAAQKALALFEVRNDVVHSHLQLIDGECQAAVYLNTRNTNTLYPVARVLTLAQHRILTEDALRLAIEIDAWATGPKR